MDNQNSTSQSGSANSETEVFSELRDLSQRLHETLHHLNLDSSVIDVSREKIPEAMNGLDYVIEKTHEAANQTLDLVEDSMPLASDIGARARALAQEWEQFRRRELSFDKFKPLSDALFQFLNDVGDQSGRLGANLSAILLAQEYQDLTGQVIKRVMADVKSVDEQLRKITSSKPISEKEPVVPSETPDVRGKGPVIDPEIETNFATDQDDVDDILSELDL